MAKVEKLLEAWRVNPPTEVPRERVLSILDRFFEGRWDSKRGSHIVVRDPRLKGIPGYGPEGDFDIPVKGGQKVKGVYLKRLVETIDLLEEKLG